MQTKLILILILALTSGVISCQSDNQETKTEKIEIENKQDEKPYLRVDSSEIRVSSVLRSKQMFLHAKLFFSSNADSILYANVSIKYSDKYDKDWFSETIKIKDIDCSFNGVCELDFGISYSKNTHKYYSERLGTDVSTFDMVLMNAKDFEYYNSKDNYKGKPINLNFENSSGYDRILIPDPKIEVISFK